MTHSHVPMPLRKHIRVSKRMCHSRPVFVLFDWEQDIKSGQDLSSGFWRKKMKHPYWLWLTASGDMGLKTISLPCAQVGVGNIFSECRCVSVLSLWVFQALGEVEGAGSRGVGWRFGNRVWWGGQIQMEMNRRVVRDWSRGDNVKYSTCADEGWVTFG